MPIGCTRQEVGSLETTLHSLQQTYLRPLIHTTQNFKWSRYTLTTLNITIANNYIPPRDSTSTHYNQLTRTYNIAYITLHYITNIPHSVLTGNVNAHSTLWHSYTDAHKGQLIADVISNSDHITLNTNTTLQQTYLPDITTVSNKLYNRTSWTTQHALSSDHLPFITTINMRHDYRLQQNRRTFTKKADWTQFTEDTESVFAQTTIPTNIHTANIFFYKHHTDGRQAQHTKGQDGQQLQALTQPHSMQNHTKKQYKESKPR